MKRFRLRLASGKTRPGLAVLLTIVAVLVLGAPFESGDS
jgi:hypothetical protein